MGTNRDIKHLAENRRVQFLCDELNDKFETLLKSNEGQEKEWAAFAKLLMNYKRGGHKLAHLDFSTCKAYPPRIEEAVGALKQELAGVIKRKNRTLHNLQFEKAEELIRVEDALRKKIELKVAEIFFGNNRHFHLRENSMITFIYSGSPLHDNMLESIIRTVFRTTPYWGRKVIENNLSGKAT